MPPTTAPARRTIGLEDAVHGQLNEASASAGGIAQSKLIAAMLHVWNKLDLAARGEAIQAVSRPRSPRRKNVA